MTKKNLSLIIILLLLCSFQKKTFKDLLIGQWAFIKFDSPKEVLLKENFLRKANEQNHGLLLTFRQDNKCVSNQSNGKKENNTLTSYKILSDNKHLVIGQDTSYIKKLDSFELILSGKMKPDIYFRKSKLSQHTLSTTHPK